MKDETSIFGAKPERLDRLVFEALQDSEAEESSPTASLGAVLERPGGQIGRYKLLSVLGEGGMGIVYLGEQKQPIRRQVALKVIKPGMDSKRVITRFEAERQALALLDHPNIAHVHDAGTTEAGRPYFVMEYVKGLSITEHCDRHKLNIEQRLRLFQQVCQAVQHAHQKGIIHRDIKPSNILVSMQDDKAVPKIIDFGVAKAIAQPLTERTLATEQTQLLGTPEYMSPEQADMATEDIDTRSDIYSLGVLLYVLLTGVLPFDSDTFRTGGIEHIRQIIRGTDPKTPSTRLTKLGEEAKKVAENRRTEIGTLAKHLRKELEWIPLKAMRKERSERYRSASELSDDIDNYLKGIPLIAGPPGTGYKLKKFVRRNRILVGGVTAVLVVLLAGIVVSTIFAIGQARARVEAQAIADFLTNDVLSSVNDANSYEQNLSYILNTASKKLESKFTDLPLVEASIRNTLGWAYKGMNEQTKAAQQFECALAICEKNLGEAHLRTINNMFILGHVYMAQNRFDDAYRILNRHFQIVQREYATDYKLPFNALGSLYTGMGRYKDAEEAFLQKIEIVRRERGEGSIAVWPSLNLANVYYQQGRYDEAERLILKVPGVASANPEDWRMLGSVRILANIYRAQGRYKKAEPIYKRALDELSLKHGRRDYRTVRAMIDFACLYTDLERYEDANELLNEVRESTRWLVSEGRVYLYMPRYLNSLAVLRTKQDHFDEAERLFQEALEGWKANLGDISNDHPHTLETINDFGVLRREQKNYPEAEKLLRKALDVRQNKLGNDHPACFESMHELAVLYKEQERYEEAEKYLLEAVEGRRLKLGDTHPHTKESIKTLIDLYQAWNKPEKAKEWCKKLP
jgi:serine/threonine protein kinase